MGLPVLSHPFSVAYFRTKSTASYVGQNLGSLIPFLVSGLKIWQNHFISKLSESV